MVDRVLMQGGVLKISKVGVDVHTALPADLLFSLTKYPQMTVMSGNAFISSSAHIPFGITMPYRPRYMSQGTHDNTTYARLPYYTAKLYNIRWSAGRTYTTGIDFFVSHPRTIFFAVLRFPA
jgi:hypothetical protein